MEADGGGIYRSAFATSCRANAIVVAELNPFEGRLRQHEDATEHREGDGLDEILPFNREAEEPRRLLATIARACSNDPVPVEESPEGVVLCAFAPPLAKKFISE